MAYPRKRLDPWDCANVPVVSRECHQTSDEPHSRSHKCSRVPRPGITSIEGQLETCLKCRVKVYRFEIIDQTVHRVQNTQTEMSPDRDICANGGLCAFSCACDISNKFTKFCSAT